MMKTIQYVASATLLLSSIACTEAAVVLQTATYGSHTYKLIGGDSGSRLTWYAAQAAAVTLGGNLVTVDDEAENTFLLNTFGASAISAAPFGGGLVSLLLGLNDAAQEGHFVWADGTPVSYTNWVPGEPASSAVDEDFIGMVVGPGFGTPGQWHDILSDFRANDVTFGVVEIAPSNVPVQLSVSLTETPDSHLVGIAFNYEAVVTNNGTTPLTFVHLSVSLPDSVNFISPSDFCTFSLKLVDCNIGSLLPGQSVTRTITVTPGLQGEISATATVTSSETGASATDNSATAVTTVAAATDLPVADLAIRFGGPRRVKLNKKPIFSLTISNRSAISVPQTVISGQFPDNVKLVKLPGFCTRNDQNLVSCQIGTLRQKFSKTFKLKAKATRKGVISTTATISSVAISDSVPENNTTPISVTVK